MGIIVFVVLLVVVDRVPIVIACTRKPQNKSRALVDGLIARENVFALLGLSLLTRPLN